MNLQILLANKHTSLSAAAYVLAKAGAALGGIWMPEHKAQFEQTAGVIESAAVGWGLLMAGDAKATPPAPRPADDETKAEKP